MKRGDCFGEEALVDVVTREGAFHHGMAVVPQSLEITEARAVGFVLRRELPVRR